MSQSATSNGTATRLPNPPAGRKQPPVIVRRFSLGSCSITLKRWPSDGTHSIEISQREYGDGGEYSNINVPLHMAPAIQSALGTAFGMGQRAESEQA